MRLIIRVGYFNFLFGKGANVNELIATFDDMRIVNEQGYGPEKRYIVSGEEHPLITLVPDDSISLPDNRTEFLDRFHIVAAERDKLSGENYTLKKQIDEMKKSAQSILGEEKEKNQ